MVGGPVKFLLNFKKDMVMKAVDLFGDVIFAYTREQALSDGVLVDITGFAHRIFKISVAVSQAVWADYIESSLLGRSDRENARATEWRALDVLEALYRQIKLNQESGNDDTTVLFKTMLMLGEGAAKGVKAVVFKSVICGGDNGEPVITIMLPEES